MDGPNDKGRKFKEVHKVDGPHKGSRLQSTIWTDPMTRVENLNKSTKWTEPQRVKTIVHNVDEPNDKGRKFKEVHKVDGPHKGSRLQSTIWTNPMTRLENLNKSTKWTDLTRGQDYSPQYGQIQ